MLKLPGQINVIAVGKLRTPHWRTAQDDYLARLQRYVSVDLIEVKDAVGRSLPEHVAVQKEGERLLKAAEGTQWRILLTEHGKLMRSDQLARYLHRQMSRYGRIAFLLGGPIGFSEEVTAVADFQWSLSPLTFPHELARVLLLEQLYRACTILNNEQYHK